MYFGPRFPVWVDTGYGNGVLSFMKLYIRTEMCNSFTVVMYESYRLTLCLFCRQDVFFDAYAPSWTQLFCDGAQI
jgi:hypothetical protein